MKITNYIPAQHIAAQLYELYVGFSSTHPNVDRWVEIRKRHITDALGEPFCVLVDCLANKWLGQELDGEDRIPVDEFKALDSLALDKRPVGWVPTGERYGVLQAPNMPIMLNYLCTAVMLFNVDEADKLPPEYVKRMFDELKAALPSFGEPAAPWRLKYFSDPDFYEHDKEFVPSLVSQHVFTADMNCIAEPYYVNGKYVEFLCPLGRCIAWQGE